MKNRKRMKNRKNDESINQINLNQSNTNQLINTINYVTDTTGINSVSQKPCLEGFKEDFLPFYRDENNVTLPMFFGESTTIQLPKGIKRDVSRLPKKVWNKIDRNKKLAIEKCLLLASSLTYTVFNDNGDYWKGLSSKLLHQQFKKGNDNTRIYKHIIKALKYSTNATLPIIESKKNELGKDSYQEGNYPKQYKFHNCRIKQSLDTYCLQFKETIDKRRVQQLEDLAKAVQNTIGRNLISVYNKIKLPTESEIKERAKYLITQNYYSKKGKKLIFLNKKTKSYYSNFEERSFVEENIKQFQYLTNKGYMIPKIGNFKSGGRVVDSFNLMPSWIRAIVKIDDESIEELDFTALHPNIAMLLYNGSEHQVTHQKVAESLKMPLREVKIEHLSFFNKRIADMKKSILFKYYLNKEREMLENIIKDKKEFGYKITSKRLFKKEVEIMSSIIEELNRLDIYVLYVYDALYCKKSDKKIVYEIMNNIIKKHQVNTSIG